MHWTTTEGWKIMLSNWVAHCGCGFCLSIINLLQILFQRLFVVFIVVRVRFRVLGVLRALHDRDWHFPSRKTSILFDERRRFEVYAWVRSLTPCQSSSAFISSTDNLSLCAYCSLSSFCQRVNLTRSFLYANPHWTLMLLFTHKIFKLNKIGIVFFWGGPNNSRKNSQNPPPAFGKKNKPHHFAWFLLLWRKNSRTPLTNILGG